MIDDMIDEDCDYDSYIYIYLYIHIMIHIMIQYPFSSCEVETCHEIFKGNRLNSWKWNVVNSINSR